MALTGAMALLCAAPAGAVNVPRVTGGTVVLGGSPGVPVANPRTSTVYVPVQCTTDFCQPNKPGHVLDVIDAATCNVKVTSGCRVTDFSSAAVSVINGSACKAGVIKGCPRIARLQAAGSQPFGVSVNQLTGTVYVTQLFQAGAMSILRSQSGR